jgi:hypothetical protein
MRFRWLTALFLLAAPLSRAADDPGKEVFGQVVVRVFHVTDGDPKLAGEGAKALAPAAVERL